MQPAEGRRRTANQLFECRENGSVLPLEQQALCRLSLPDVFGLQAPHEIQRVEAAEPHHGRLRGTRGREPINPSAVVAALQVEVGLDVVRDRVGMLDRLAVHVDDVERSVGRVHEIDGAEPVVGRGDELGVLVGAPRGHEHAVTRERLAVHQVAADVADERVPPECRRIGVSPIDRDAGRGGEVTDGELFRAGKRAQHRRVRDAAPCADDPPRLGRAAAKDGRGRPLFGNRADRFGNRHIRIAANVAVLEHDLLDVVAVVADETVSPVVERQAELLAPRDRRNLQRCGIERDVLAMNGENRLAVADKVAPVASAGKHDPVVEAPFKAVGDGLDVVAAEPAQDDFSDIGDAVSVGVLEVPEIGRREDEDAPFVAADGSGPRQLVREDGAAIGLAVTVGVFEQPDDAGVLLPPPRGLSFVGSQEKG